MKRTATSRRFASICFALACCAPASAPTEAAAEPEAETVWRLATLDDGRVRLISPTTYIIAATVQHDRAMILAEDATVLVGDWTIAAPHLMIDPRIDAVNWPQE